MVSYKHAANRQCRDAVVDRGKGGHTRAVGAQLILCRSQQRTDSRDDAPCDALACRTCSGGIVESIDGLLDLDMLAESLLPTVALDVADLAHEPRVRDGVAVLRRDLRRANLDRDVWIVVVRGAEREPRAAVEATELLALRFVRPEARIGARR